VGKVHCCYEGNQIRDETHFCVQADPDQALYHADAQGVIELYADKVLSSNYLHSVKVSFTYIDYFGTPSKFICILNLII
jgi:hypothetical protein